MSSSPKLFFKHLEGTTFVAPTDQRSTTTLSITVNFQRQSTPQSVIKLPQFNQATKIQLNATKSKTKDHPKKPKVANFTVKEQRDDE